jgi:hypothetical protein
MARGPIILAPDRKAFCRDEGPQHDSPWFCRQPHPPIALRPDRDEQFDGLGQLTALAFSPDGLVCAAGDCHGAIVVWNLDS